MLSYNLKGDNMIGVFVLSAAITITPHLDNTGEKKDAIKAVGKAVYKQHRIDKKLRQLEKRYLSDEVRFYGGVVINLGKIITEKKITYEWTF